MKKIIIALALICFAASPLFAAAITDATKPLGSMKFAASVEDNYIFDRDIDKGDGDTKFELEKMNQIYAKLGLGIMEGLNIYAKLGGSNAGDIAHNTGSAELKIETEYGFMWGVGASYVKPLSDGWAIGVDAQFDWVKSDVHKVKYFDVVASDIGGKILDFGFQGTPFVSKKIEIPSYNWTLTPYIGPKFSYFKTTTDSAIKYRSGSTNRTDGWTLKGKNYVGLVVGSDLAFSNNAALALEGRFFDETAITVGGTYKF